MTYPLLEKAPKDHSSEEFLQFLRDNNKVVMEIKGWLIIENCKYHTAGRPWWTAFYTKQGFPKRANYGRLFMKTPVGWNMMMKEPDVRSVKRPHVHIYQP